MFGLAGILFLTTLVLLSLKPGLGNGVMESYHVYTAIQYRLATTDITSVIRNTDSVTRNIPFRVELPKNAFITKFTMATGGKTYIGEIRERTSGSQVLFDESGLSNVQASRDGNKFGVKLPVSGGDNATYRLVYQERLYRQEGVYEHRLYLGLNQVVKDLNVETYIAENVGITLVEVPVMRPLSRINADYGTATNALAVINRLGSNRAQVIFSPSPGQQGSGGLSHLFLVRYDVYHHPDGDIVIQDGYFIHFYAIDTTPIPKDIIFVIDVSGSMGWDNKMEQMKAAMLRIMDDIQPKDYFNIVLFSHYAYNWKSNFVPATPSYLSEAKAYIHRLMDGGGTNIRAGIVNAREIFYRRTVTERIAMIFFLTDGQDRSPVEDFPSIPIYGLAFGDDADLEYIKELCAKNSGFSQKIYTEMDAANQVTNFYEKVSSVSLRKITLRYNSSIVDLSSLTPTEFSMVVNGSEVMVIGKLKERVKSFDAVVEVEGEAGVSVKVKKVDDVKTLKPEKYGSKPVSTNIESVWALTTIQNLLQEDEKKATTTGSTEKLDKVLELSVKYGFVTPLTSIVINDPERHQQLVESAVKNEEEKQGDRMSEFIKARPSTTTVTTTTTTTTTRMPMCPPSTTVDEAIKSDMLTLSNMSRIAEKCLNVNPGALRYLRASMRAITRFRGAHKPKAAQSDNQTNSVSPRSVDIGPFIIHHNGREVCVNPMPTFEEKMSYLLLACPNGTSLYLLMDSSYTLNSPNAARLILKSSNEFASVYLGASSSWQLYGDLEFRSDSPSRDEMTLQVSCFNINLHRAINSQGVIYEINVYLENQTFSHSYTGIMGDNFNENNNEEPNTDCAPLLDEHRLVDKYKKPTKMFLAYFLDTVYDIVSNFPPVLWE